MKNTFKEWCIVTGEKNNFDKRHNFKSWNDYVKLREDAEGSSDCGAGNSGSSATFASGESSGEGALEGGTFMTTQSVALYPTPLGKKGKSIIKRHNEMIEK